MSSQAATILRHAVVFMAAVEEGQLRRAADRLHLDPSAVSRRISALEDSLGTELFVRTRGGLRLTEAGGLLADGLRNALGAIDETLAQVRSATPAKERKLRIGLVDGAMRLPEFTRALAALKRRHVNVEVVLSALPSQQQVQALLEHGVDVAIVRQGVALAPGLECKTIARHPLSLALPVDHPLAAKDAVTLADLKEQPLLWPRADVAPGVAAKLAEAFAGAGIVPTILMESGTTESVISMAAAGQAFGFVDPAQGRIIEGVVLKRITDLDVDMVMQLLWRSGPASALVQDFVAQVGEGTVPDGE